MRNESGKFERVNNSIPIKIGSKVISVEFVNLVGDVHRIDVIVGGGVGIAGKEDWFAKIKSKTSTMEVLMRENTAKVGQTLDENVVVGAGD